MPKIGQDTTPAPIPQLPPDQPVAVAGKKWAAIAVVLLVVVAGAGFMFSDKLSTGKVLGTNTSYQAVFLTNGQVYFGKLDSSGDWLTLSDIYYLQVTQQLQPADNGKTTSTDSTQQPNIQLVKLGSELHGPQDEMHIEKDKVLFWENMKDDSKVVQAIRKYQETKK